MKISFEWVARENAGRSASCRSSRPRRRWHRVQPGHPLQGAGEDRCSATFPESSRNRHSAIAIANLAALAVPLFHVDEVTPARRAGLQAAPRREPRPRSFRPTWLAANLTSRSAAPNGVGLRLARGADLQSTTLSRKGCGAGATTPTRSPLAAVESGLRIQHDAGTVLEAVDSWRRRPAMALALPSWRSCGSSFDDRPSTLAAVTAYYAFFSLFPLISVSWSSSPYSGSSSRTTRPSTSTCWIPRSPASPSSVLNSGTRSNR